MLTESMIESNNPALLLVEDSEDDAFFFRRAFQKSGAPCSLHHVTNGAQAIEFLESASNCDDRSFPFLIFLDLKMPVMNGFEFLEWMSTQAFRSAVQVVVLSGSEHQDDKTRAAQLGAVDYLVKPVRADDLQRFLQRMHPQRLGEPI
jgi:CheY-like chemotaxis protein